SRGNMVEMTVRVYDRDDAGANCRDARQDALCVVAGVDDDGLMRGSTRQQIAIGSKRTHHDTLDEWHSCQRRPKGLGHRACGASSLWRGAREETPPPPL